MRDIGRGVIDLDADEGGAGLVGLDENRAVADERAGAAVHGGQLYPLSRLAEGGRILLVIVVRPGRGIASHRARNAAI